MDTAMKRITRAKARIGRVPYPWMLQRLVDGEASLLFAEDATPYASPVARGA
jgi:hypothetical protein